MAKHKHYRKKAVISGNHVELHEHEFPVIYGFKGKQGGRKSGGFSSTQRSAEHRKRASTKAKINLIRLINTNFTSAGGKKGRDSFKFITLTFRDGSMPDLTDVKRAYAEFKKYARKLREICKAIGKHFNYIVVVEFQDENGRGAVHFHMVADIPVIPVTRDIAEQWKRDGKLPQDYNAKLNHFDIWGHGTVTVKAIREASQHRDTGAAIETVDVGEYIASYMVKDFGDPRLRGLKAYSCSQGLRRPTVAYDSEAERAIKGLGNVNVVREGSYPDTYHDTPVKYRKFNKRKIT